MVCAGLETERKRVAYRASRRSMAETERIFQRFLDAELATLDGESCRSVLEFLERSDPDILDWLWGVKSPPDGLAHRWVAVLGRYRGEGGAPTA
ncbi:MAG: succinate dehydrogenase assembly factor 2 [Magnetococcales bacterium]|nr:succinate dehydrogenase assembly factor 2 [Magnetococcales bacterium]